MQYLTDYEPAFYKKLKAGKIFTWSLIFHQNKGSLHLSKDLRELLGYEPFGEPFDWDVFVQTRVHPDARGAAMHDALMSKKHLEYSIYSEYRIWNKKTGAWQWVLAFGCADEIDRESEYARISGGLQDIQERMEAMRLRREQSRLDTIISAASLGTWDWNLRTGEVSYSKTWADIAGVALEDIQGNPDAWSKAVLPDDLNLAMAAVDAHSRGETPMFEAEFRMRRPDGSVIWAVGRGRAVERDEDGRAVRLMGVIQDITGSKEAEAELVRSKKQLEQAVEERTRLLHEARQRIESILAVAGPLPGEAGPPGGRLSRETPAGAVPEGGPGHQEHAAEPYADPAANLALGLSKAFDLITERMWWYKAVIDSVPFPIFVTDMNKCWTYLNNPALAVLGENSPGGVIGSKARSWGVDRTPHILPGRSHDEDTIHINRYHPELERYFQGQGAYLYDQSGRRIGHIEAMQDVTEARDADERTRIMLDATPLACNFWDSDFNNIDCNLAAAKLFHLSGKQEYLDRFAELSPERQPCGGLSRELVREYIGRAFKEGRYRFEWIHQYPDGTPVPSEITLVRVEYGKNHIVAGYIRDLREIKAKEAELDKERHLLLRIMDSSPVCFVILVKGIIHFATPYAKKFFGVEIGGNIAEFYNNREERTAFLHEVQSTGTLNWHIVSVRAADGSAREMLANAFLAEYYDEPCIMSWFLDITEMRETQRQLGLARDAAEDSARAKGDFLANMSHEIRTPMNAILGMTRLALDTQLTAKQRDYLMKAEQSARALLRIINDILDFSKIEAGKLEMELVNFDPRRVMQSVVDMFHEQAESHGLSLVLEIDESIPGYLRGDPLRLQQILINLVGNAIKFTERGGVFLRVSPLEVSGTAATLRFSVRDTGIGLTPEQQAKLFSAFSQGDTSTTRRYGGTGLGLAISKSLVEMMHGGISCVSRAGQGAEFIFTAVFARDMPEAAATSAPGQGAGALAADPVPPRPEDGVAHLRGRCILVAEDNEINQIIAREMLEKAGFAVEIASNGREAVEMALAKRYDLIFMDIQMPDMDGLAATKELRARRLEMPIIAMTAHAMVGDREKSLAVGMNDHVTKPIDGQEIFNVIARWLSPSARPSESEHPGSPRPGISEPARLQEQIVTELPSSLPGIDVAAGLARVAGNKKLYVKLLRHVASDAPATKEKLSAAIGSGDAKTVREIAHSLKGSSGNLALLDVAAAAEHLETAAKAENFAELFMHLDALEKALDQYVSVVNTLEGL